MKKALRKMYDTLSKWFSFLGYLVTEDWIGYSYIRTVCFLAYFPIFVILTLSFEAVICITLSLTVLFLILDSRKSVVVRKDPEAFVKSEKIERIVDILFYVVTTSFFVFIISILVLDTFGLENWINYFTMPTLWVVFFGGGVIPLVFLNVIGDSILTLMRRLPDKVRKHLKFFLKLYVSPMLRVRARLCVVLDVLSENPNKRTIRRKMSLFKESLDIYNSHLTERYDFAIRKPEKFNKYVRLTALSNDKEHINKIKDGLSTLIEFMDKKEEEPYEFVKTIKAMIGEPVNKPIDLYDEIEIEPSSLRKGINAHSGLMKFLIMALLTLGSIIVSIVLKWL